MIEKGAGLIKVGATGFRPNGERFASMSPEALELAVRASRDAGLKIAAHCHGLEGTGQAVEAGIDSIEHETYVDDRHNRHQKKHRRRAEPCSPRSQCHLREHWPYGYDVRSVASLLTRF